MYYMYLGMCMGHHGALAVVLTEVTVTNDIPKHVRCPNYNTTQQNILDTILGAGR